MKSWIKSIFKKLKNDEGKPLITIHINSAALLHNLLEFKKVKPTNKVAPVLKSNAYGHGLIQVAQILKNRAEFFIVDSYFEAKYLRSEWINTPLLIIGYVLPELINKSKLKNISYTINSLESLYAIKSHTKIHLKIDTGMHRQGISVEEMDYAFDYIRRSKNIILEGICSHFADADGIDASYTEKQIWLWNSIVDKTIKTFGTVKYTHISNTFGHKFVNEIHANTSRLGIGLYGLVDIAGFDLQPALEMKTIIAGVKKIYKGEAIGYNKTYIAEQDMTIANIPVGYYEALDRRLSSKGYVKVKGIQVPIIGRVSMNISTIDITSLENIKIGDEVQVMSPMKGDRNSIENMAKICETIAYEIAVKINERIKRIVV